LIIEVLNGLPLALTQAGAYLGQTNMAASDYVKHYHSTWKDLMKKQDRFPLQEYADRSVLTTWTISYERVRGRSEEAAGLLRLWGFLDCGDLWYELVATANSLDRSIEMPSWLPRLVTNSLEFSEALQILSHYSLVDAKVQASGHSIHSVLHEWCYYLAEGKEREMLFWLAASIVARVARAAPGQSLPRLRNRLLPHGCRVARVADDENFLQLPDPNDLTLGASVFFGLGMLFECGPKLNEAKKMYMRAISRYSSALGPRHKLTLDTMSKLGGVYHRQGKFSEAERIYERVLANFETTFEPTHISTVSTINELGNLYWEQKKLDEAEKTYRRALAKFETEFGPTHRTTLCTVRYLGDICREQVKVDEAKKMYRRAKTGYEVRYGPDHILTSSVREDLDFLC
jgi:tetratricopeptide (TPR) repeat protein